MKIRSVEQLYDFTSRELAWRKKELYSLRSMMRKSGLSRSQKNVILRSIIALTYAHWEGFVRSCATAYINFVAMQKLKYNELSSNFLALAIRPILMSAFQSRQAGDHQKIVEFFQTKLSRQSSIQYKGMVTTRSNLSSSVFRDIICTLGFDYSNYETKEKLLDERLLKARNQIAHGEYLTLDQSEVFDLQDQLIGLMEYFRNQVDNAASLKAFKLDTGEYSI